MRNQAKTAHVTSHIEKDAVYRMDIHRPVIHRDSINRMVIHKPVIHRTCSRQLDTHRDLTQTKPVIHRTTFLGRA